MIKLRTFALLTLATTLSLIVCWRVSVDAQQLQKSAEPSTPAGLGPSTEVGGLRLLKFSGVAHVQPGQPLPPVVGVTIGVFTDQQGGSPLWMETQNVELDPHGNYIVLLGSTTGEGVPLNVFSSNEPRWLGVRTSLSQTEEQPRLLLVGVPYALKAADADTLGGKPASAYMLSPAEDDKPSQVGESTTAAPVAPRAVISGATDCIPKFLNPTDIGCSSMSETGGRVGVGGLVGAGVNPPLDTMHVQLSNTNGAFTGYAVQNLASSPTAYSGMLFYDQNGALGQFQGFNNSTHEYRINNIASGGSINFMIGSNSKFLVANSGNIGIGTTSPSAKLDVAGTSKASAFGLPATASDGTGVLTLGGNRFLHGVGINTFLGLNAGNLTMVGSGNTATGYSALSNNTSGSINTANGNSALINNTTGGGNTAVGYSSLFNNGSGGNFNTAVGASALTTNSTGMNNTAVGSAAGVTSNFGNGNTTGANNTFIGANSGPGTSTQLNNATAIGANALVSADNTLVLGDSTVSVAIGAATAATKLQVVGDIRVGTSGTNGCIQGFDGTALAGTCSSDLRLKQSIEPFGPVLDRVVGLQPVSYEWKADEHAEYHFGSGKTNGLIAQEVEKLFPSMVGVDERGYKTVNYSQLPLLLLQAVRELKADNDRLRVEMDAQRRQFQSNLDSLNLLLGIH